MVSANAFIKTAKSVLCEKRVKFIKKLMLFWWGSITTEDNLVLQTELIKLIGHGKEFKS